jgi:Methylene-tetrahydrofolate reductase C terminal
MYSVRLWSIRRAGFWNRFYTGLENALVASAPVLRWIGYERLERPFAFLERHVKGVLFDCQMCGQCVLSSTGMSCPMNCPKNIRNGPCGGVRANGHCEVKPEMRCVWVEAWSGAGRIKGGLDKIRVVQAPVDRRLEGRSSWLKVVRERTAEVKS